MNEPPTVKSVHPVVSALDLLPQKSATEQAIGSLVLRLGYLHHVIEMNLSSILGMDPHRGRVLTEDLPFSSLLVRFIRAVKDTRPKSNHLKELKELLARLHKINEKRNRLVHAFWTFPSDGPPSLVPKKGNIISLSAPTAAEILDLQKETDTFIFEFFECLARIYKPDIKNHPSRPNKAP